MSTYNLPSVTQSLFHDDLSRLFALLWNIPCPFLDHSRSKYNFKPSYSLLTLHFRDSPFVYFSDGFISHLFGDNANINVKSRLYEGLKFY